MPQIGHNGQAVQIDGFTRANADERFLLPRRNLLINGGFDIWQRGESFSGFNSYNADRWRDGVDVAPTQNNISRAIQADGTSALFADVVTTGVVQIYQRIERGCNITSGKELTYSFDLWGSGTVAVVVKEEASGNDIHRESIPVLADRFRQSISFTVPAQTSGFDNYLQIGFEVQGAATVHIAQVQLEIGDIATPFEQRHIGEELALCKRYYQKVNTAQNVITPLGANSNYGGVSCPCMEMRADPVVDNYTVMTRYTYAGDGGNTQITGTFGYDYDAQSFHGDVGHSMNQPGWLNAYANLDAEL